LAKWGEPETRTTQLLASRKPSPQFADQFSFSQLRNAVTPSKKAEIAALIHFIRGKRVMLDSDLADLYGVETKQINQAVKRNPERFPEDFYFPLNNQELEILKSQIGTSSSWGGRRRSTPFAFSEQGVAMLSSVLRSKEAAIVNVQIMRAFVAMREA